MIPCISFENILPKSINVKHVWPVFQYLMGIETELSQVIMIKFSKIIKPMKTNLFPRQMTGNQ